MFYWFGAGLIVTVVSGAAFIDYRIEKLSVNNLPIRIHLINLAMIQISQLATINI
ncbi:hypothetical protein ACIQXF_07170 [Lysinibacillus sp. NPDC097231]|uniref:hypothetical protein n=1 Tax=Lysinibacillus sp. NPDC097231 TaxID=3364142 RepID=UPI00382CFB46